MAVGEEPQPPTGGARPVPYRSLFRYATRKERLAVWLGCLAAVATGAVPAAGPVGGPIGVPAWWPARPLACKQASPQLPPCIFGVPSCSFHSAGAMTPVYSIMFGRLLNAFDAVYLEGKVKRIALDIVGVSFGVFVSGEQLAGAGRRGGAGWGWGWAWTEALGRLPGSAATAG